MRRQTCGSPLRDRLRHRGLQRGRRLSGALGMLIGVSALAGAQQRSPNPFASPSTQQVILRERTPLAADSSRRSFTPPRRYLVALVIGAFVGSRVGLHYARTTAPDNDPTCGLGSTARAIPIILAGTLVGGIGAVTVVWVVDSVRRPWRWRERPTLPPPPNARCSRQRINCALASLALFPSAAAQLQRWASHPAATSTAR